MDIRHTPRSFSRNSSFAAIAIGLLTLVVGLNTAMFSLVDAVLFKPLPVKSPDELVTINGERRDLSYLIFDQLRLRTSNTSSPLPVTDGATRIETTSVKSRTQTPRVEVPLVLREYSSVQNAKPSISRKTTHEDQADEVEIARLRSECPLSGDSNVIRKRVSLKQKLLVIVRLPADELLGGAVESPDDIQKRFVRSADCPVDDTPVCAAPREDRSTSDRAVRNQICTPLVGRKIEAEAEDEGPDNGQTPAPPPDRAQERRR